MMSLLNQTAEPRLPDDLPTMANTGLATPKQKTKKVSATKNSCTPFCDGKVECPKHHELVLTLINCNDCPGAKSNLLQFQKCVVKYIDEGWDKNDVVPDPSEGLRLPLMHLACAMARCLAIEWLIDYGFDPNVKSESTGQFALHRAICGMYRSRTKFSTKELIPKLNRMMSSMPKQLMFHDEVNGDTPLHTAAIMLTSLDSKSQFFQACIEAIGKAAMKMETSTNTILDAINYEGKTALHLLSASKRKVEFCASAIRALVSAGADKTIRDNNGETALDIAFAGGVQNIVHELLRNGEHLGLGFYSELDQDQDIPVSTTTNLFPSPSRTDDSDTNWSERTSSRSASTPVNDRPLMPTMVPTSIKRELIPEQVVSDNYNSPCACDPTDDDASVQEASSQSPAVLKYLGDAGLLGDVSALVARARAQDEANMRKIETRANEIDIQIKNKEHCIQKMKQELNSLRNKRKECDADYDRLKKRMHSCENAMKELPNL